MIAVLLMIVGIATLGAVTAAIAAWMVGQVQHADSATQPVVPERQPQVPRGSLPDRR